MVSVEKLVSDNVHVPDPALSKALDINNHQMETEKKNMSEYLLMKMLMVAVLWKR